MRSKSPYIVADIGGTNARFGLVTGLSSDHLKLKIEQQRTYPSNNFDNLEQVTRHYMESLGDVTLSGACLAVAGPVTGDSVRLTNLNWAFSMSDVKRALNLPKLKVINDFAAYAYATPYIDSSNIISLNEGQAIKGCPIAVVGPGTGFGVAALVPNGNSWTVLPTEGGHITLSSKTPLQQEVIQALSTEFSHISIETLLSGPGLINLYRGLTKVEGVSPESLKASQISQRALQQPSSLEYRCLKLFCCWLGQSCGDLALALGARGGVYLGGGILLRFSDFLISSDFMNRFLAKGQMQEYLHQMPVKLVTEGNSALSGAAAWFEHN